MRAAKNPWDANCGPHPFHWTADRYGIVATISSRQAAADGKKRAKRAIEDNAREARGLREKYQGCCAPGPGAAVG